MREQYWISHYDSYNNGYNCNTGGQTNKTHSEETRKKLSEGRIGENNPMYGKRVNHSEETRKKISNGLRGRQLSEETKRKISESKKHLSAESRKRISDAKKGHKYNQKKVYQIDNMTGEIIAEFPSLLDATLAMNPNAKNASPIVKVCKHGGTCYGYRWSYKDTFDETTNITYEHIYPNERKTAHYTKDGVFIKVYRSAAIASRETGAHKSSIINCCKGNRKTAGGYIWRYYESN